MFATPENRIDLHLPPSLTMSDRKLFHSDADEDYLPMQGPNWNALPVACFERVISEAEEDKFSSLSATFRSRIKKVSTGPDGYKHVAACPVDGCQHTSTDKLMSTTANHCDRHLWTKHFPKRYVYTHVWHMSESEWDEKKLWKVGLPGITWQADASLIRSDHLLAHVRKFHSSKQHRSKYDRSQAIGPVGSPATVRSHSPDAADGSLLMEKQVGTMLDTKSDAAHSQSSFLTSSRSTWRVY